MRKYPSLFISFLVLSLLMPNMSASSQILPRYERRGAPSQDVTGSYLIRKGDTLVRVLSRKFGISGNKRKIMREIVRANPSAFPTGNPNRMLAGQYLTLPGQNAHNTGRFRIREEIFYVR